MTPEAPFPTVGGGALRSASLFEYLRTRFETDVIAFRQPGARDPRECFPAGRARGIQVIDLPFHSRSFMARAIRNARRAISGDPPLIDRFAGFEREMSQAIAGRHYDLCLIEHFWCAAYEKQLRPHANRVVLDLHNIESAWHRAMGRGEPWPLGTFYDRFAGVAEKLERVWLPRFDQVLVTSKQDAAKVVGISPATACLVYPNALPFAARPAKVERDVIVFSGTLEYPPNASAIRHFRDRMWPAIRESCPELIWEIVGRNPGAVAHLTAGDSRIDLVGEVEDAVGRIGSAKIAIVPLLAGSGTRIKILEAWAAATAVISTSIGAEGLEYAAGQDLVLADSPAEFSRAVIQLISEREERVRIGDAGRSLFEKKYTWQRAWTELEQSLTAG